MKEHLQQQIIALRNIGPLPPGEIKDKQLDNFFIEISKLNIPIIERVSGEIRYRHVYYIDSEEAFVILITIIQTKSSCMIIIDANGCE